MEEKVEKNTNKKIKRKKNTLEVNASESRDSCSEADSLSNCLKMRFKGLTVPQKWAVNFTTDLQN